MGEMSELILSNSSVVHDELDRLLSECVEISRMSSRLRLRRLSPASSSTSQVRWSRRLLLSMCSQVESAVLLLESMLHIDMPMYNVLVRDKPVRHHYTRDALLRHRQHVPETLSSHIGHLLRQVVERESNASSDTDTKSWRDIRTILDLR
jgi:hypothetical protein